jgi:hypothetical protein
MEDKLITGRFSKEEEEYVRTHCKTNTDKEIAKALNRTERAIVNVRTRLKLKKPRSKRKRKYNTKANRESYIALLDETGKRQLFEKEIRNSARFGALEEILDEGEKDLYIEKYLDFMMDPSIETMTSMEKDSLHQKIMAEIRINRYLREEKDMRESGSPQFSRARDIAQCEEIILKCQQSLGTERRQRLKNINDQAVTFVNLVKEMKNPGLRLQMGREAAMLRYMGQKFYNDHLGAGENIVSGRDEKFDIDANFKVEEPEGLTSNFLPRGVDEKD